MDGDFAMYPLFYACLYSYYMYTIACNVHVYIYIFPAVLALMYCNYPNRTFIYLLLNVSTPSFLLRGTGRGPDSSGTSCMALLVLILVYIRPLFKH